MIAPCGHTRLPKGLSLRVSVTDRCLLRCQYCMPREGIRRCRQQDILSYEEIVNFVHGVQQYFRLQKVRITGGDPLLRRGIQKLVNMLSCLGIPDIALTTNGQLLEEKAFLLKEAGLHRVNISLDSLNAETFYSLSRGGSLKKTLAGIEAALDHGLRPVKLNMVVIRGENHTEVEDMLSFAVEHGCEMRFLELMPIGVASARFDQWFVSSDEVLSRLSRAFRTTPMPARPGETSRNCLVHDKSGREGIIGFVSPCSRPFCAGCRRLRLTADGHLVACLARDHRFFVKPLLGSGQPAGGENLKRCIEHVLAQKRTHAKFARHEPMAAIGG